LIYDIANKLLLQWPGTVPALAIFIQGDRSPLSYGAATTHAREIFINYGVLLHAESEDELAAVIGHELSHILLEHDKTLDYKKKMHGTVTVLGQARDLYASADALSYNQDSRRLVLDSSASDALKQSAMQQMVAKQLYDSVHASLFSRDNEYDADRLAMDLLVGAGYAPMGLKMSLERMAHSYELSSDIANQFSENSRKLLQQQSLHLNKLANRRQQGEYDYRASLKRLQHELSDSSLDIGKQSMIKWTSRSHPVPEKRVEQITAYLYDNFPRAVRRRRPSRQSAQRFKSGPIAEQLAHYQAANETLEAIALGKPAIAAQRAQLAISAPTANEPYSRYIVFFQRRAQGDRHAADILRDLDQSGFVPIYASVTIADALANAGALQPALATATGTESRYGTIPGFYPVKIKQALSSGSRAQVEQLAHACFDATPGNDALGDRCAKLSGVSQPGIAEQGVPGAINKIGKSLFGGNNPLFGSGK
jgi:Zn-dependent protease with chaperone function